MIWLVERFYTSEIWFFPHPLPLPLSPHVSNPDRRNTGRLRKRDNLLTGEGGGEEQISYHGEKACSSINHSILSGMYIIQDLIPPTSICAYVDGIIDDKF
jgi:hypothetical protein